MREALLTVLLLLICAAIFALGVKLAMRQQKPLRITLWETRSSAIVYAEDCSRENSMYHAVRYRTEGEGRAPRWAVMTYAREPAGAFAAVYHRGQEA